MTEANSGTGSTNQIRVSPICQAKGCETTATHAISSQNGHPNGEWKLCWGHFDEVDGRDPWYDEDRQWTLRKLYYRCPDGGRISHNLILKYKSKGGYPCSCGERHPPQIIQ
jgi:hypothetical protein